MQTPEWAPLVRNYEQERVSVRAESSLSIEHPLLPKQAQSAANAKPPPAVASDPLSAGSGVANTFVDPLSDPLGALAVTDASDFNPLMDMPSAAAPSASNDSKESISAMKKSEENEEARQTAAAIREDELNTPWKVKKKQIYSEYQVEGSITMSAAAYNDFEGSGLDDGAQTRHLDKYSQRLAALEQRTLNKATVIITQAQFESHVHKLSNDLDVAWARDERVASLKIAIQLSKLLSDTSHPQFYPCMFVLVTDVLERFSNMVYERLLGKAEESLGYKLPPCFTSQDVPAAARETCRNWFYKTACIVELLPRLLVETTLLKCYQFLTDDEMPQILTRLASMCRGLGDPLVSTYARTYLVVVGQSVAPTTTKYGICMMQDIITSFRMLRDTHHQIELVRCGIDEERYVKLMVPGVEWVMKCVGRGASKEVFQTLLHTYREHCNDAMVLGKLLAAFDGSYYAHGALAMVQLIRLAIPSFYTVVDVYADLGNQLAMFPPPEEQLMPVLNEVWRDVGKCDPTNPKQLASYVRTAAAWTDCVQRHYSPRELLVVLGDLTNKLALVNGDLSDDVLRQLEHLLATLISKGASFGATVLTSDHLLRIMDAFKGPRKVMLCMDVLQAFQKTVPATGDAVLINTMFDVGRNLHDSVDMLSAEGDRRHISKLLNGFIDKIDFGKDLEQQLSTFVECRAIFCNLDMVKDRLVERVMELASKAYNMMKGKHSKKTAAFAKACLAYCHITIPSIRSVQRRLALLLRCANVSLQNQCLPQTDTFLKAAISLIPEMPPQEDGVVEGRGKVHTEARLAAYLKSLLSTLVVVPGHPDHGPFYIVKGLLNAIPRYPWQEHTGMLTSVYIDMLGLLACYAQKKFPYSLPQVESNDVLYCGAPGYTEELAKCITQCVEDILKQLTALGNAKGPGGAQEAKLAQARQVLGLVNKMVGCMEITEGVGAFVMKLINLANTNKDSFSAQDSRYFHTTMAYVVKQAKSSANAAKLQDLISFA